MKKFIKIGLIAVNALLVILIVLGLWRCGSYGRTLVSQQAAELWRGESEERFAQVSLFTPVGKGMELTDIMGFRYSLDGKLGDAGIEAQENQKLWNDAYAAFSTKNVKGAKEASNVTVIGVGGDFFGFHPYELMSGSYISEDDIMGDRVVLDQELAWSLFGASDLEGMSVTINDKPYYVAGVIKRESDKFSERAYTGGPMMFISYSSLKEMDEELKISCYELVVANPISGFGKNLLQEGFQITEGTGGNLIVENSERYSFSAIWSMFKNFGDRSVISGGYTLPYWENAARISEVFIARLWVVMAVLGIFPLIGLVWLFVKLIQLLSRKLKQGKTAAKEAWDDRYGRMEEFKERRAEKKRQPKSKRHGRRRKAAPEQPPVPPQERPIYDEQAIAMDVESIMKELMDDNNN